MNYLLKIYSFFSYELVIILSEQHFVCTEIQTYGTLRIPAIKIIIKTKMRFGNSAE